MKHTQAEILRAIGEGLPVEYRVKLSDDPVMYWSCWNSVTANEKAYIFSDGYEWRIKPEPVKVGLIAYRTDNLYSSDIGCEIRKPRMGEAPNIWLYFDDEGKLVTATLPEEELS